MTKDFLDTAELCLRNEACRFQATRKDNKERESRLEPNCLHQTTALDQAAAPMDKECQLLLVNSSVENQKLTDHAIKTFLEKNNVIQDFCYDAYVSS